MSGMPMHGGFYCIYKRRRPGELNYNASHEGRYQTYADQPDCEDIEATLTRHAQLLVAAGIDHVVVRLICVRG
jgi:hypothetical protein